MNQRTRDYLIILLITLFIFIGLFIRSQPFTSTDDYYFLNYIYGKTDALEVSNPVVEWVFDLIPESIILIKLIMLVISFVTLCILYECCRLISSSHALIGVVIAAGFTWFNTIFLRLEDDLFGLPFIFLSLYFILRYEKKGTDYFDKNILLSLLFLGIASLLWQYSIIFVVAYFLITKYHPYYLFLSLAFFPFLLLTTFIPEFAVTENYPIIGLFVLALLGFAYIKKYMLPKLMLPILLFSVLCLFNFKYGFFVVFPFLVLAIVNVYKNANTQQKNTILVLYILFLISTPYIIYHTFPTDNTLELIDVAQSTAIDMNKPMEIEWSLGYFAIWNGYDTNMYGHPQEHSTKNVIVVTMTGDKSVNDCNIIKKDKMVKVVNC
jgi:hypothetical protein